MKLVLNLMLVVSLVSVVGIEESNAKISLKSLEKEVKRAGKNAEDVVRSTRDTLTGAREDQRKREAEEAQRLAQIQKENAERERQTLIRTSNEQITLLSQNIEMSGLYTSTLNEVIVTQKSLLKIVEAELSTRVKVKEYMVRALVYVRDMNQNSFDLMSLFFTSVEKSSDSIQAASDNLNSQDMNQSMEDLKQSKLSLETIKFAAESQGKTLDAFLTEAIQLTEKSDLENIYTELSSIVAKSENLLATVEADLADKVSRKASLEATVASLK